MFEGIGEISDQLIKSNWTGRDSHQEIWLGIIWVKIELIERKVIKSQNEG